MCFEIDIYSIIYVVIVRFLNKKIVKKVGLFF